MKSITLHGMAWLISIKHLVSLLIWTTAIDRQEPFLKNPLHCFMFFSSGLKIVKSLINKGRHNTVPIPLQHFYIMLYYVLTLNFSNNLVTTTPPIDSVRQFYFRCRGIHHQTSSEREVYWMVMSGSSSCEFSGEMDLGGQMMQPGIWVSLSLPFALFAARFVLRKLILWARVRAIDPIGLHSLCSHTSFIIPQKSWVLPSIFLPRLSNK